MRDIVDGKVIEKEEAENHYFIKVDPIDCIKQQDFFIKAIERCEENMAQSIKQIEEGIDDEKVKDEEKDSWQELQDSSNSEYLRKTVYPLLYPALQIIERERPNDPLSFIALYMLKNKQLVNLPKKKVSVIDEIEETEVKETVIDPLQLVSDSAAPGATSSGDVAPSQIEKTTSKKSKK